ncbi:LTA synthase family protein [Halanaerobium kushneri]|uniref:Phosphoglycerol transferase MdoB n=1 Tax=Halanaerobium kushneri TaxID=56779 RepID=A0A1N6XR91_9FIRM|nr:LTA synthase family protein [Halanaerobium kushneri]SIR04895.1 Phosphoglycerol transferase MdoB [Halanaerobium kushneri]
MFSSLKFRKRDKLFFIFLLIGFLIKYNYFNWYIFNVPSLKILLLKNLIIFMAFILLSGIILKNKRRKIITLVTYLIFSFLFIANLYYNRYFGNYLSLTDMIMGQGIRPFRVLTRHLINWKLDPFFIFDIPILIYLTVKSKAETPILKKSEFSRKNLLKNNFILVLLIIILFFTQLIYSYSLFPADSLMELFNHSTPAFVNVYGIIPLYLAEYQELKHKSQRSREISNKDLEIDLRKVETEKELSSEAELDNIKNVIIIQLESLDAKLIDYKYNGQEVTPFLNKLKDKSKYFSDIYAHHINGSFDAEFSFFTSLYPINRNYTFRSNDMREFNTIVNVLRQDGYNTYAFHGNKEGFFYRDKGYLEMGFDRFYSREDFSVSEAVIGEDTYLGINDYDLFDQSIDYLDQAKEPFLSVFITVTSHTPFTFYPEEYKVKEFSDIETTIVRDYFNSMHFVDHSLEMFFKKIKANSMMEDTLFVIYSDHVADINREEYKSGDNFANNRNIKEPEQIPLFIYHQDIEPEVIKKSGTHTDIAPTILDIMGYQEKPEGFLGVSLLKEIENPLFFLHEIPQIIYKDQLFIRVPAGPEEESEFEKISYKKSTGDLNVELPEKEKERLNNTINYMQEVMNRFLSE